MGALPHAQGTTFRVWAPAATAVAVVGPFNDWNPATHPLAAEADGYWAADWPDLPVGTEYKFSLTTPAGELRRNDPYAREVTHSAGSSVVPEHSFDWEDDHFRMPAWNELVIYELHVGTEFLNIREGFKTSRVAVQDIVYLEALDNYTKIHTTQRRYLTLMNLKHLCEQLPATRFMRIHRTFAVALDKISALSGADLLVNGTVLPVGRTFRPQVAAFLWEG